MNVVLFRFLFLPKEIKLLKDHGYQWSEVYQVKDKRGVEYLKIIKLIDTKI